MWISLGTFNLTQDWQFTANTKAEIFRVSHSLTNASNKYLKAVIAQIIDDEDLQIYQPQRLTYRTEKEIFNLVPDIKQSRKIGVKRLDDSGLIWDVTIEYLHDSYLPNPFNQLISRLEELMAIYSRNPILPLDPNSDRVNLQAGTPTKVLNANPRRRALKIYAGSVPVLVFGGVDGNKPVKVLQTVLPNEVFEVPVTGNGSTYMGEVWFLASAETQPSFLELNAPM